MMYTWYAEVAVPKTKSSGKLLRFNEITSRILRDEIIFNATAIAIKIKSQRRKTVLHAMYNVMT